MQSEAEKEYRSARDSVARRKSGEASAEERRRLRSAALCAFRSRLYPEDRFVIEVAIHRIGTTVLVALPFEVLSGVALQLKQSHPHAVVVSAANGYQGYLPQAFEYKRAAMRPRRIRALRTGTMDKLLNKVSEELDRI